MPKMSELDPHLELFVDGFGRLIVARVNTTDVENGNRHAVSLSRTASVLSLGEIIIPFRDLPDSRPAPTRLWPSWRLATRLRKLSPAALTMASRSRCERVRTLRAQGHEGDADDTYELWFHIKAHFTCE